jgi:hypothetical protein
MKNDKPLLHRPSGRPKTIYAVMDGSKTIVQIYTTMVLAFKHAPKNGSVMPITPGLLGQYFGNDTVVRAFLETCNAGRWLP